MTERVFRIKTLAIQDDGEGISNKNLGEIFDPYYSTRKNGTGLGLAIVSRILEQHEANITTESKVGTGTTFTISFPLPKD